jgi:ATP-binding cassette, subfamily B, bacterial
MAVEGYRWLLREYLRPRAGSVLLLAATLGLSILIQLSIPQLLRTFIDTATGNGAEGQLRMLALSFLGLAIVNQLLSGGATWLAASVGWSATNAMRSDLFRHVMGLDMAWHKDRTPGELIERIDGDVTSISNFFSQFIVRVAMAVLMIIGVLALLWREDYRVGLVLSIFVLLVGALLHWRRGVAVQPTTEEREMSARVFGFVEERLNGMDDIRANGAGGWTMQRFHALQSEWYGKGLHAWWLRATIFITMGSAFAVGNVLVLALGVWLYAQGALTLGTVYLLIHYVALLETPIDQITQQMQEFQKAAAGMGRVSQLRAMQPTIIGGKEQLPADGALQVEFDSVRFRYAEREVLKGIRFTLQPGETLGILGRTGSGKSTLIRLLFRFYDPTHGVIRLAGKDLRTLDRNSMSQRVALVTQEVQLFHGTVEDNLSFFRESVSRERIAALLEEPWLKHWAARLPQGMDSMLSSGGSSLSAGEAQLLALARAFLSQPGLVILDEPSSRLDPATEKQLQEAIDRLLARSTGIIIAHRLKTVERVDRILILSDGEVVEFGRREELAAKADSRYAALLRLADENLNVDEMPE